MDQLLINNTVFLILFFYSAIGVLIAEGIGKKWLRYATKPLLMPLLLFFYLINTSLVEAVLIIVLCFSFMGDFLLMWPEKKTFFIAGLSSFLLAQIAYIVFIIGKLPEISQLPYWVWFLAVAYIVTGIIIYKALLPYLHDMKIPVIIYMLSLLGMSFLSLMLYMSHESKAALLAFAGSLLFIASDTILAFHSFKKPYRLTAVWFMFTYIAAQMFLIFGFMSL